MLTQQIHNRALAAANLATVQMMKENPECCYPCGFAWVKARVKGNTVLGKSFKAKAYADVVCEALGDQSIVIAQERMD